MLAEKRVPLTARPWWLARKKIIILVVIIDVIFCNNSRRYTPLSVSKSTLRPLHIRFASSTKRCRHVYLWGQLERTEKCIEKFSVTFCVEIVPVKQ